jgi:ABC-type lipoprotein release transport system permease subunit
MLLNRKIRASGIAEMVIAITIIAICIGVASIIFVRTTSVMSSFENVIHQTEIQNQILDELLTNNAIELPEGVNNETESNEEIQTEYYRGTNEEIIWTQDVLTNE